MPREVPLAADTPLEVERIRIEIRRRMTFAQRFDAWCELMELAIATAEAGIRRAHPDADDREVFLRRAARSLDRETMMRVYGWDPAAHP